MAGGPRRGVQLARGEIFLGETIGKLRGKFRLSHMVHGESKLPKLRRELMSSVFER